MAAAYPPVQLSGQIKYREHSADFGRVSVHATGYWVSKTRIHAVTLCQMGTRETNPVVSARRKK